MNADAIRSAMRKRYTPPNCEIIFEVPNAVSGRATRHADAMVLHMWASRGYELEGFEFKSSRSDWQRELRIPAKAESHFALCDRWWLVTPATVLVAKMPEIPGPWGWMQIGSDGSFNVLKAAPKLVPTKARDWVFALALVRAAQSIDHGEIARLVEKGVGDREANFTARVNAEASRLVGTTVKANERHVAIIAKIEAAVGGRIDWLGDEAILEAVRLVYAARIGTRYLPLEGPATRLRTAATALEEAAKALKTVMPDAEND